MDTQLRKIEASVTGMISSNSWETKWSRPDDIPCQGCLPQTCLPFPKRTDAQPSKGSNSQQPVWSQLCSGSQGPLTNPPRCRLGHLTPAEQAGLVPKRPQFRPPRARGVLLATLAPTSPKRRGRGLIRRAPHSTSPPAGPALGPAQPISPGS